MNQIPQEYPQTSKLYFSKAAWLDIDVVFYHPTGHGGERKEGRGVQVGWILR
jgi:hypothetical protein